MHTQWILKTTTPTALRVMLEVRWRPNLTFKDAVLVITDNKKRCKPLRWYARDAADCLDILDFCKDAAIEFVACRERGENWDGGGSHE